jgi:hypothetical protein
MATCEAMEFALKGSMFLEMPNLKIDNILRLFPLTDIPTPNHRNYNQGIPIFVVCYVSLTGFDGNLSPDL